MKNCLGCHGDDAQGGLTFDTFAGIVAGCGGKLIVPGNPQASILMQKIQASGDGRMPKGGKPLPLEDARKIGAWIAGERSLRVRTTPSSANWRRTAPPEERDGADRHRHGDGRRKGLVQTRHRPLYGQSVRRLS